MVTYATQQTDPEKAKLSSIGTTTTTPVTTQTPEQLRTQATATTPVEQQKTPAQPTQPVDTAQTTQTTPVTDVNTTSYWSTAGGKLKKNPNFIPKEKRVGEQTNKAQMMDSKTVATAYLSNGMTATELEDLRTTDPLKYKEAKLEIEKQRTLDAINQTGDTFLATNQQLFDSYLQKWDEIAGSNEGKNIRAEVFKQYGLDASNEKIKTYTTQIDEVEAEMEALNNWTGTGDALADRGDMVRRSQELTKKRNDLVKVRANEVDYYKLGLEQADAVAEDYKAQQGQELEMLGKKFEMLTGMSQMEFEMKDKQARDYLTQIDNKIGAVQLEIAQQQQEQRDYIANTSLLSMYSDFSQQEQAVLASLPPETLTQVLKKADEINKNIFDKEMKMLDYGLDAQKFGFEKEKFYNGVKNVQNVEGTIVYSDAMGNVLNTFRPGSIEASGLDTTQIIDFCTTKRGRENVQCGELVNDYWKLATGVRLGVEDTFASKVQAIQKYGQSPVPMAGGAFAYDVGTYGHTGIVTDVAPDGTITTLEANIGGTEEGSPPVQKTYAPGQYKGWTFSVSPQNNKIIEENAKSMLVGIGGTEGERAEYAKMLVERSKQFGGDLKRAKADLGLITKADQDFIETRKKEIQSLKESTGLGQARMTYQLIEQGNWDGITDTATIVGFLKTIDPASVARESEVASIQNALSAVGQIEQKVMKAGTGRKLTETQRTQIKNAMQTIIGAADRKFSDTMLNLINEYETRGIDYTNYITQNDLKKIVKAPVTKKDNIQYGLTNEMEYEQWLYKVGPQYNEEDYFIF